MKNYRFSLFTGLIFLLNLSAQAGEVGLKALDYLHSSNAPMTALAAGFGSPIVLVQGFDLRPNAPEWIEPFESVLKENRPVYFFKWTSRIPLKNTSLIFERELTTLLSLYPTQSITVIGYSAGGVIAQLAFQRMQLSEDISRIQFHSVASPYFGYGAPPIAVMGSPFIGSGTTQLGRGNKHRILQAQSFGACTHWVTTNCDLDKHACIRNRIAPQTGNKDGSDSMPCGNDHVIGVDDESHVHVLTSIVPRILSGEAAK